MSKAKIAIATLGTVASLGVAALPLTSFAAETVSGNVLLAVEVEPAIAMTIEGNNDGNSSYAASATGVSTYTPSALSTNDDFDGYDAAAGTAYDSSNLQLSSSYVALLPNATATATSTVTVYTNSTSGYTLAVKDADSTTALTNQSDATKTIPASATTTAGTAGWSIAGGTLAASAITAADQTVKQTNAATSGGDATTMTYTIATDTDQATGVYTDTITYTATTR